jgi:glycosyltransferase involved in cell wall biosynthesis
MNTYRNGLTELAPPELPVRGARKPTPAHPERTDGVAHHPAVPDQDTLRQCAWEIGERRAGDTFVPTVNHVGLASVSPGHGFAHWRILPAWVEQTARQRGAAWHHCRLVLRLYDVSYIVFNGLNAHRIQDHTLPALHGHYFFTSPRAGTSQLAEVGFLLRNGEFIPAARSHHVQFSPDSPSTRHSHAALYADGRRVEEVANVWEHDHVLRERRRPKLRAPLRIAALAWTASACGHDGVTARLVSELAAGQRAHGHDVHVFLPSSGLLDGYRQADGVHYHGLAVRREGTPLEQAKAFGTAAQECLRDFPAFDLVHLHDWIAGLGSWGGTQPTVLSLASIEATRRNGGPVTDLSQAIEEAEREVAQVADCVLTPDWLRERAIKELGLEGGRVHAFPMEGRVANEWEAPLDYGQVKKEIGFGPLDRLILFVGPLEHAAGVDLLVEALPTLLGRNNQLRLAFAGAGMMYGALEHRARELGVGWAVRLLGHVEGHRLPRLLRAAEAVALPSRYRVPFDDAVVDLARKAGRPVVTTHGGPAHLVRHEENGLVTYDNPGSVVWALDRILGDPAHARRMGQNGRRAGDAGPVWGEVARHYLELCSACFPCLTATPC